REIEGHKAFAVPVEEAWRIHTASQQGLSDACRSRFAMSTEWGKLEIVSVIDGLPESLLESLPEEVAAAALKIFGDGIVVLKMHRSPASAETQGELVIARRNPKALWISDYEDRMIYDGRKKGDAKYAAMAALLHSLLPEGVPAHLADLLNGRERVAA
ncbi:MAG: hypothetical protein KGJ06_09945, partial [Pseudomonadota bacterium]|nr:hypothetical protein [Pseudomonadota bacterium]